MSLQVTILVFAATVAFTSAMLAIVYRALQDRLGSHSSGPLERFVSPQRFLAIRFLGAVLAFALMASILCLYGVDSWMATLFFGSVVSWLGWKLPRWWIGVKISRRKTLFDAQILNLTMTLANGLRSGQALPQALDAAAHRMAEPMQGELAIVLREARLGMDLSESLEHLHQRMPSEDLRLLLTSVRLTLQSGGSLADVLDRMVELIRSRTEFQAKLKTMTASGRFEAIAMSLAPLFVYVILRLIDPRLMKPLTTTVAGWVTISCVIVAITIGFAIINKIVTIEV